MKTDLLGLSFVCMIAIWLILAYYQLIKIIMNITQSPTRQKYPLSGKKIAKKTVAGLLSVTVILIIAIIAVTVLLAGNELGFVTPWVVSVFIILYLLACLITYVYQRWYFAVYFYDLHEDFIVIRKGPITPREITIPYERIQDVYVDQDLLDRFFGLYDVHLSSATYASGEAAHIDGVEKAAADGLRSQLLEIVGKRISKKDKTGM